MSHVDERRLGTWLIEIADTLLDEKPIWKSHGDERRAGSLSLNTRKGVWWDFAANTGGGAIGLIMHLRQYSYADATHWAEAWLLEHAGDGSGIGEHDDDDASPPSAAQAREIAAALLDPAGTPAERYLFSRGINGPLPGCIRYLPMGPACRVGECAVVGILTARRRPVAFQRGNLTLDGQKSVLSPVKQRFNLECTEGAVFEVRAASNVTDIAADAIIVEGVENALSLAMLDRTFRVVGLAGIATLRSVPVKRGERIVVFRDSDPVGSPADQALITGIDALLLEGAGVRVTPMAAGDANAIMQTEGLERLAELIAAAVPATLSLRGKTIELSRLEPLDYAQQRTGAAKEYKVPVGTIDTEVKKLRKKNEPPPLEEEPPPAEEPPTPPWPDPVDGAALLEELAETVSRFVIMPQEQRWTVALWVLFTHTFAAAKTAPKLWIKSPVKRCGKSRLIELLNVLTARPFMAGKMSASAFFRIVSLRQPTILLDEVDNFIARDEELIGLINNGFDRDGPPAIVNVRIGDDWVPKEFPVFCPQALAGLGKLDDTNADRCIPIVLERKSRQQKTERFRRRVKAALADGVARRAARWGADNVAALDDTLENGEQITLEEVNDRAEEAWQILLAIANRAGGDWPRRAKQAAIKLSGDDTFDPDADGVGIQLLVDIRTVFDEMPDPPAGIGKRIASGDLVARLIAMEDRPWPEFGNGHSPLTTNKLAYLLKPFHISPGTIRVGQQTPKGYKRKSFKTVFERYVPPLTSTRSGDGDFAATPTQHQVFCALEANFYAATEVWCVGVKNTKKPSNSAGCVGVAAKSRQTRGGARKNPLNGGAEERVCEHCRAPITGNRVKRFCSPRCRTEAHLKRWAPEPVTLIAAAVRETAADHPDWSPARIAKHLGQPRSLVHQVLGR